MRLALFILWVISVMFETYVQIQHARSEDPNTLRSKIGLFSTGMLAGASGAWLLFFELPTHELIPITLLVGAVNALMSTYLLPGKLSVWYTKRK